MKIFSVLDPFFHALSDGKLIRLTVAWVLRVLAALVALASLMWFFRFFSWGIRAESYSGGADSRATGILFGCILFALIGLVWGYIAAGLLIFRARSVAELEESHFTVLSILSTLLRLNGELAFVTYSLVGIGGCIFVWLANFSPFGLFGVLGESVPLLGRLGSGFEGGNNVFLSGIELALLLILIAFFSIVISYALAELTVVLVEIALNTRGLSKAPVAAVPVPVPVITPRAAPSPSQAGVEPSSTMTTLNLSSSATETRRCRKCGQPLDAGATFCGECGMPVG
jgi:hypothetical protein